MRFCECGCGATLVGKQKFANGACQKRVWRIEHPLVEEMAIPLPTITEDPSISECKHCGGWKTKENRPFICDDCTGKTYLEAPLLRLKLCEPDNPVRAVMLYFGPMNVYSRRAGPFLTEIVCGVEEVRRLLRWLVKKVSGKVTSDEVALVAMVPTAALVQEASTQMGGKEPEFRTAKDFWYGLHN
jgi:hypothetical protein